MSYNTKSLESETVTIVNATSSSYVLKNSDYKPVYWDNKFYEAQAKAFGRGDCKPSGDFIFHQNEKATITIKPDGTLVINGDINEVRTDRSYECILNLVKNFQKMKKDFDQLRTEYNELSDIAIKMDDVLTKKMNTELWAKYRDKCLATLDVKDIPDEIKEENPIKTNAADAIQRLQLNNPHAPMASVIGNCES